MAAIKATNPNNANEILKKGVCPSEYLKLKKESTKSKTTVRLSKRITEKIDDIEMYDGIEIEDDEDTEQEDYNRLLRGRG